MNEYGYFIWGAYGISAAVLAGLVGYIVADLRRQRRLIAMLEAHGTPRRPAKRAPKAPGGSGRTAS